MSHTFSLVPDEKIEKQEEFASSILTAYIKGTTAVTNNRIMAHTPNTVAGLIPAGYNNVTIALKQVSAVRLNTEYNAKGLIVAFIAGLVMLLSLGSSFIVTVVLALITVAGLSEGIVTSILISSSGTDNKIPVVFWEKSKAESLVESLNNTLARM